VLGVGFQRFWCWGDRYSLRHFPSSSSIILSQFDPGQQTTGRKSGRMSMVWCVFLRATGQNAQRVVDRGIPSNSFLLEEGIKTPRNEFPGGFGFVEREQGAALFPCLRS
jgi:hypothetical protein